MKIQKVITIHKFTGEAPCALLPFVRSVTKAQIPPFVTKISGSVPARRCYYLHDNIGLREKISDNHLRERLQSSLTKKGQLKWRRRG
ncbi:hypothetical protein SULPSESMR1_04738 (plasmid) [Pseudosulfitobacter pseudonitzschiae]|uniref:Uncharacterized protein n=1 Tax=Pseudosulfitobacter pseudonitzschiae TaxID=1402135 RepID=A0A221K626_9RHOB|nr:hypothetical protein SULPSESMR1_04738 [Pseudosulfitobacter pseudonitzschiae]